MDYRRMYDSSDMLYAYDLEDAAGRDVAVQIEKVWAGELTGERGRKSKKPIVKFVGRDKKFALNKTNGKAIARMYGKDADKWPGKWVALYVTTVDYDGETRDCIRIRPEIPKGKRNTGKQPDAVNAEPTSDRKTPETRAELEAALREQITGTPASNEPDADELEQIKRDDLEAAKS